MIDINKYPALFDSNFVNTKKRLTDLFMGRNQGGLGYVVPLYSLEKGGLPPGPDVPRSRVHVEEYWERMLAYRLEAADSRVWGHDWGVPMVNPNYHGYGLSSVVFGSTYTEVPCGTVPVCKTLDDIDKLPEVTLEHDSLRHAHSFMRYIDSVAQGKLPVQMFHFDGPASTAGLIVDTSEMLVSTIEQPEKLREFLDVVTDLYIAFVGKQREITWNLSAQCMHDTWLPRECGVLCEDDTIINFSPRAFTEFIAPCYNKISDAFGGIGIHCCGDFSHLYTALRDNVKNLRAIWMNAGENPFEKAAEAFRGTETVIIPRWPMNKVKTFRNRVEFVLDTLRNKPDDLSVFIQAHWMPWAFDGTAEPEDNENIIGYELMRILERYSQRGVV